MSLLRAMDPSWREHLHPLERAAIENPGEPFRWAIFADWLDENATCPRDHWKAQALRHRAFPELFEHPMHELTRCILTNSPLPSSPAFGPCPR